MSGRNEDGMLRPALAMGAVMAHTMHLRPSFGGYDPGELRGKPGRRDKAKRPSTLRGSAAKRRKAKSKETKKSRRRNR